MASRADESKNVRNFRNSVRRKSIVEAVAVALVSIFLVSAAGAFELKTDNPDLTARWDNTVKYSAAQRVKGASAAITADTNLDDGDRNFGKRLISNRVDLLSEFDVAYKNVGARLSGAAWYDAVYSRSNSNGSSATANSFSVSNDQFTDATRALHGRKAEILDAFVFAKGDLGDGKLANVRVGKHTLLYGESLFFGSNGISGGQGPFDVVKLLSVPNTQFKELAMPVEQVSGQIPTGRRLTSNRSARTSSVPARSASWWRRTSAQAFCSCPCSISILRPESRSTIGGSQRNLRRCGRSTRTRRSRSTSQVLPRWSATSSRA